MSLIHNELQRVSVTYTVTDRYVKIDLSYVFVFETISEFDWMWTNVNDWFEKLNEKDEKSTFFDVFAASNGTTIVRQESTK